MEDRARIQMNVAALCKAIRQQNEDEINRMVANIGADVLVDLNRIANAAEATCKALQAIGQVLEAGAAK
jgi:hypothetical protein